MRKAAAVIAVAAGLDVAGGLAFAATNHEPAATGLYWAVTTATTVGYGDITPHGTASRIIATAVMLTVIPLFAATFSLVTTELTAVHVRSEGQATRDHHETLAGGLHARLDQAGIPREAPVVGGEPPGPAGLTTTPLGPAAPAERPRAAGPRKTRNH